MLASGKHIHALMNLRRIEGGMLGPSFVSPVIAPVTFDHDNIIHTLPSITLLRRLDPQHCDGVYPSS